MSRAMASPSPLCECSCSMFTPMLGPRSSPPWSDFSGCLSLGCCGCCVIPALFCDVGCVPAITVLLPKFGVEVLTALVGDTVSSTPSATVLTNRAGGLVSLSNIRSALREALAQYEDLRWVTPHSFRRSLATAVRDGLGIEAAQQQLGHAEMATTEQHYAQRRTTGPDAREVLDKWAGQGE